MQRPLPAAQQRPASGALTARPCQREQQSSAVRRQARQPATLGGPDPHPPTRGLGFRVYPTHRSGQPPPWSRPPGSGSGVGGRWQGQGGGKDEARPGLPAIMHIPVRGKADQRVPALPTRSFGQRRPVLQPPPWPLPTPPHMPLHPTSLATPDLSSPPLAAHPPPCTPFQPTCTCGPASQHVRPPHPPACSPALRACGRS